LGQNIQCQYHQVLR